jgi:hypothetical protein
MPADKEPLDRVTGWMIPGTKVHKLAGSRGIEYPYSHAAVRQGGPMRLFTLTLRG